MDELSEILKRRTGPAVLIFDLYDRLLYTNQEALSLVPELQHVGNCWAETDHPALAGIYGACCTVKESLANNDFEAQCGFYLCPASHEETGPLISVRAMPIGVRGGPEYDHIMVLVERVTERRTVDLERARRTFKLTGREAELLGLLSRGLTNKAIAEKLFISEHTVKDHVKNIMKKVGVRHRGEIIAALK